MKYGDIWIFQGQYVVVDTSSAEWRASLDMTWKNQTSTASFPRHSRHPDLSLFHPQVPLPNPSTNVRQRKKKRMPLAVVMVSKLFSLHQGYNCPNIWCHNWRQMFSQAGFIDKHEHYECACSTEVLRNFGQHSACGFLYLQVLCHPRPKYGAPIVRAWLEDCRDMGSNTSIVWF